MTKEIRTVLTVLMVFVLVFAAALMRDLYGSDRVLLLIAAAVMVCVHNVSECGVERFAAPVIIRSEPPEEKTRPPE